MRNFPVAQVILIGAREGNRSCRDPRSTGAGLLEEGQEDRRGAEFPSDVENSPEG